MIIKPVVIRPESLNLDAEYHVKGLTRFLDDLPELQGTLYAKVFYSKSAHGRMVAMDLSEASGYPGVVRVFTSRDIPGENQIGGIIPDEPLFAAGEVHYIGQPVGMIVAQSELAAHRAAALVRMEIAPQPVVTDPRVAFEKGMLLSPSRTFSTGDPERVFPDCPYVFEGVAETGGQEHVYLEPQGAYAIPREKSGVFIYSSTQGPTAVQRTTARVLGISMNLVEVEVGNIGGGFGGKEDQASPWAVMAALAAVSLQRPVKLVLDRKDDLQMTGKRHPYSSDFRIGLDKDLKIVAYQATFYQNGGAAADLSPAVLERTLFHATNSYFIPNVRVTAHCCKTNLPPNTAFRGFGGPQGMYVIESAIHRAAEGLGVPAWEIQEKNLLRDNDEMPYGQIMAQTQIRKCWTVVRKGIGLENLREDIRKFNQANKYLKKGMAVMPVCFGISFTNTQMNNGRALVHVYSDGSVGVSTGAVEMGQGVNTKMIQTAASLLGVHHSKVHLLQTNTTRVANTSPSAASATTDLNGWALADACRQILDRLTPLAKAELDAGEEDQLTFRDGKVYVDRKKSMLPWETLVRIALSRRINLSAKGHYATPMIHFDKTVEKGHPFLYYAYGAAVWNCTVDCLRGVYEFDSVHLIHDWGDTRNFAVDLGQVEGGLVQGMGWMTMENLIYNEKGELKSNSLATYKIPDIYSVPKKLDTQFLAFGGWNLAFSNAKAVGEPPLMYGIGAWFAVANGILAFNPAAKLDYSAPITHEKVLLALYS